MYLAGRCARYRRGHSQSVLGSGDRVRGWRDPAVAVYDAHRRRLRDRARALRGSLRQTRGYSVPLRAGRRALGHEPATHRGAGGSDRADLRRASVPPDRQGRKRQKAGPKTPWPGKPRWVSCSLLGPGAGADQRKAGHRTNHFRRDARRSKRAVPGGGVDAGHRAKPENRSCGARQQPFRRHRSRCWRGRDGRTGGAGADGCPAFPSSASIRTTRPCRGS